MGKTEAHSRRRGAHIQHRDRALKPVMSCLMEEVAESDDAGGFPGKVHRQACRATREYSRDGIQFLSAVPQVVSGYDEVGGAEGCIRREQKAVLTIPESMARSLRNARWMHRCR